MPAGLVVLGVTLPHVQVGPTIDDKGKLAEVLFGLGLGVLGLVTLVYSMLFGVVQWSAGTFSPRLNLFRDDPLVWRTFAVTVGEFVFCVSAGLTISNTPQVSELVLVIAIIGTLTVFVMIRALQNHAFRSLQLGHVLAAVSARGRAVIDDLYPLRLSASDGELLTAEMDPSAARRTVTWIGPTALVQQLDLRQLVDSVAHADALVVFRVGVGGTLHEASPVADIHRGDLPDDVVRTAIVGGTERSFDQDPMLAIRLLADIALRALSPAVNDPATAVDALDATEGLLRTLAVRKLRMGDVVDRDGVRRVQLVLPTREDYLRTAVEDLLPVATGVPMVLERLQRLLADLLEMSPPPRQAAPGRLSDRVQVLA